MRAATARPNAQLLPTRTLGRGVRLDAEMIDDGPLGVTRRRHATAERDAIAQLQTPRPRARRGVGDPPSRMSSRPVMCPTPSSPMCRSLTVARTV